MRARRHSRAAVGSLPGPHEPFRVIPGIGMAMKGHGRVGGVGLERIPAPPPAGTHGFGLQHAMLDAGLLQERAERQPGLAGADDDQRQPCRQAARQAGRERGGCPGKSPGRSMQGLDPGHCAGVSRAFNGSRSEKCCRSGRRPWCLAGTAVRASRRARPSGGQATMAGKTDTPREAWARQRPLPPTAVISPSAPAVRMAAAVHRPLPEPPCPLKPSR